MYAPIIIPTLNRYDHLVRCIESLKKNPLACETELYISLDYPPSEKYYDGYCKVKNYLENELIDGFKKINKYYQTENLKPAGNIRFLRSQVYKSYDRFIFTEDDNEFSKDFLDYINKGLDLFEKDNDVLAICGYRDERPWNFVEGNVIKSQIFHAWGYGTWKNKIQEGVEWINRKNFENLVHNTDFCNKLYQTRYKAYYTYIESLLANLNDNGSVYIDDNGEIRSIDYTIGIYMIGCNKTCILPKVSKVRNWGYDGSGANCGRVESIIPTDTVIDDKEFFEYDIPSPFNLDKENIEVTNEILYKKLADNAKIYRNIMCVFGIPVARKIHNAVYVIKNNKARLKYIIGKKK